MSEIARPPTTRMTLTEFLAWYEKQPEGRYELVDGLVVAMSAERVRHNRAKIRVFDAIRAALSGQNLPCEAFADGMAVAINDRFWREPDVVVQCGRAVDEDAIVVEQPLIVVEVLSPTTTRVDTFAKLSEYFSVPSISHYLIVDPERRCMVHHGRDADGKILTSIITEGPITFDPPGFTIHCGAIFPGL